MKRIALVLLCLLCLVSVCCAPRAHDSKDVTTVRVTRELKLTVHVDTRFRPAGRARIEEAAAKWRAASNGRIDIQIVHDLDFESVESVFAALGQSTLVGVMSDSPATQIVDARLNGMHAVGFTTKYPGREQHRVAIVMDRIPDSETLLSVVTHELGHVAGMPDLPTFDAVMSGASLPNAPPVTELTADDMALCRAAFYCD